MQKLTGKIAVITGAAAGIGLSLAETFAKEGARLALIDRSEAVADVASRLGPVHRGYVADLGGDKAIESTFARIVEVASRYGQHPFADTSEPPRCEPYSSQTDAF